MFLCLFTGALEVTIMESTRGRPIIEFNNIFVTIVASLAIAVGKGVVEGVLTLGVLSAVVKGLGLGEGRVTAETQGEEKGD